MKNMAFSKPLKSDLTIVYRFCILFKSFDQNF
jgi:hypothetical protein